MRLIGLNSWLRGSVIKAPSLTPPMRRGRGAYRIEKGVTMCIFCKNNCMSLLAYFVERASLCAAFAKKDACPRWPTLLGRASLHAFFAKEYVSLLKTLLERVSLCAFFAKSLHVLVGLPCWKGRH